MDKILIACVGGSCGDRPCGALMEGYAIPLAATERARAVIEAEGEQAIAELIAEAEIEPPPAGGLWVGEGILADGEEWSLSWRQPHPAELAALGMRARMRAEREQRDPPTGSGRWVFLGALV